jgi:hypothetical protein
VAEVAVSQPATDDDRLCFALGAGTASAATSLFNQAAFSTIFSGKALSGSVTWNDANSEGFVTGNEISAWSFTVTNLFGTNTFSNGIAASADFTSAYDTGTSIAPPLVVAKYSSDHDQFNPASGVLNPIVFTGVSPVPEPQEWAMLLAGLGMVSLLARSRKLRR